MEQKELQGKALITFQDNGILIFKMLPKSDIQPDDAREMVKIAADMSGDKIHCNLVDISDMSFMGGDARAVFAGQRKSTVPAVAIVNKSKLRNSFVNLYMKFSRPTIPTKAFEDVEVASKWLLTQMN